MSCFEGLYPNMVILEDDNRDTLSYSDPIFVCFFFLLELLHIKLYYITIEKNGQF